MPRSKPAHGDEPMARTTRTKALAQAQGPQAFTLPHCYFPRSYQQRTWLARERGCKRFAEVLHRRAGKDKTWLNIIIREMAYQPFCGTYLHIFPSLTQGRRDAWDAKSSPREGGMPFRAHFPPGLIMESSETEMQITMRPLPHQKPQAIPDGHGGTKLVGSVYQIMGTEKTSIDNIRGINAVGVVFSEWAEQDERAWVEILEPVLLENGGWAAFIFTPKGKNHAYRLYQAAVQFPWPAAGKLGWFTQLLTVDDTRRDAVGLGGAPLPGEDGLPVVPPEDIEALIRAGRPLEIINQEYRCSFDGYTRGTIYGTCLEEARRAGRITRVVREVNYPVGVCLDIGGDGTCAIYYQTIGHEVRILGCDFRRSMDDLKFIHTVIRARGYNIGRIELPHDSASEHTAAPSTTETNYRKAFPEARVVILRGSDGKVRKPRVEDGIRCGREQFGRLVFDQVACEAPSDPTNPEVVPSLLTALGDYHYDWNDDRKDYSGPPVHDINSHFADALRTGALHGFPKVEDAGRRELKPEDRFARMAYDPLHRAVPGPGRFAQMGGGPYGR